MDAPGPADDDVLDDADRCLLRDSALLSLSQPDAAGYLSRRATLHGWYRHWFSLHGSQLNYYDVTPRGRGPLAGSISLFRNRTTVAATPKRPREIDLVDFGGKMHALRAESEAQLHWWVQVFAIARNKIPPAKPIAVAPLLAGARGDGGKSGGGLAGGGGGGGGGGGSGGGGAGARGGGSFGEGDGAGMVELSQGRGIGAENGARADALGSSAGAGLGGDADGGGGMGAGFGVAAKSSASAVNGSARGARLSARAASSAAAANAFSSAAVSAGGAGFGDGGGGGSGSMDSAVGGGGECASRQGASAQRLAAKNLPLPSTAVDEHLNVDHVLCVVHGIGVSEEILADNVKQLQDSYADVAAKIFPDLNFRVEILVVRWRSALTNLDVHRKLQACVPIPPNPSGETNPLRQFMVHRIIDYVYYTHSRYRNNIMREITKQLNASMADFRRRRPDFQGHVSMFAHSLGGALCYDLLVRRARDDQSLLAAEGMRLDFQVANLFLAGSPLGTFLHLDPSLALGTNITTLPFRIYNMFHPHDPIATRLEPFIEERFVGVRPIVVPYWINLGIRSSTTEWLGNLWGGSSSKKGWAGSGSKASSTVPSSGFGSAAEKGDSVGGDAASPANENGATPRPAVDRRNSHGGMQSSFGKIGLGVGSDGATALTASIQRTSSVDEGGIVGADGCPVRYFAEKAQHEIIAVAQLPERLDFVLQLSSTMEEVSTSWSALRAHTEYWGSRDLMLLIMSSMIKTTHGIPDNVSRMPSIEVDSHLIDSRAHLKTTRFGRSWSEEIDVSHSGGDDGPWSTSSDRQNDSARSTQSFEDGVAEFVDKIVEESSAMHELILQHPNVRMRQGGITRSTSKGVGKGSGASGNGNAILGQARSASYGGWASYLPWFGRESSASSSSSAAATSTTAALVGVAEKSGAKQAGAASDSDLERNPGGRHGGENDGAGASSEGRGMRPLGARLKAKRTNSSFV